MQIRQRDLTESSQSKPKHDPTWKILFVDGEPGAARAAKASLKNFRYLDRKLEFIEAETTAKAMENLGMHPDIAIAFIDAALENDSTGPKLIEHIRSDLGNTAVRIIVKTDRPNLAPERMMIDKYDISDYKYKSEMTPRRLYTTIRLSLKEYHNTLTLEANRNALRHILDVTPRIFDLKLMRLEEYFEWVLAQFISVCRFGHTGMISTIDGILATVESKDFKIQATVGDFQMNSFSSARRTEIYEACKKVTAENQRVHNLRAESIVVPLKAAEQVLGFVYLECSQDLSKNDHELIQILANQCAAGLSNMKLHYDLIKSYDQSVDMLAAVSEFKDDTIGGHLHRIQELTRRLASALGLDEQEAESFAKASRLHDIGKVGIPDTVLSKPSRLSPEEFETITKHTTFGDKILEKAPRLDLAKTVARSHHEKWNGTGYPEGLTGSDIPLAARIVTVVDVFDALASPRPYKGPWHMKDIMKELEAGSGEHFDPMIVSAFLALLKNGELDDLIKEYDQIRLKHGGL